MTTATLDAVVARNKAMFATRSCTACPLHQSCRQPLSFTGRTPAQYLLLGEATDQFEDRYNKLWIGRVPKWLDVQFTDLGIPSIESSWVVTNAVCCAPPEQRVPNATEIFKCSQHLRDTVEITDPSWVLTLGAVALSAVGAKGALTSFHGRPFDMPAGLFAGRRIFPTFDPRGAVHDDKRMTDLLTDLSTFSRLIKGKIEAASIAARVGRNGRLVLPE